MIHLLRKAATIVFVALDLVYTGAFLCIYALTFICAVVVVSVVVLISPFFSERKIHDRTH